MKTFDITRSPVDVAVTEDTYAIAHGFATGAYGGYQLQLDELIVNHLGIFDGYDVPEEEEVYTEYMANLNL